jgi:hypothetical protein
VWRANIAGVAQRYSRERTFASGLVKEFRKREWLTREDVEAAYWVMLAEQGEPQWPEVDGEISAEGLVPSEPFRDWLTAHREELGYSYKDLGARLGMNPDDVSLRIRGVRPASKEMKRSLVDRALSQWGDGTTFEDLYKRAFT